MGLDYIPRWLWIVLAFCGLGLAGLVALTMATNRAAPAVARTAPEPSLAEVRAQRERAARESCGLASSQTVHYADPVEVKTMCQMKIRSRLISKESADFASLFDGDRVPESNGCETVYSSWVDGKNGLGVKVRTRFTCSYSPVTGETKIVDLQ